MHISTVPQLGGKYQVLGIVRGSGFHLQSYNGAIDEALADLEQRAVAMGAWGVIGASLHIIQTAPVWHAVIVGSAITEPA